MSADQRILVKPVPPVAAPAPEVVWEPCSRCGGQRVEFGVVDEQWSVRTCTVCNGLGERLVRA